MRFFKVLLLIPLFLISCSDEPEAGMIDEMLFLRHKGSDMPVYVRGNSASENIILIIHGGPGSNSYIYSYFFDKTLEKDYVVAYWDQRASGASQGNPKENTFTYEQVTEDANLVVKLLKQKYSKPNVFLMGHSFGVEILMQYLIDPGYSTDIKGYIAVNGTHSGFSYYYWQREWVINETKVLRLSSEIHAEAHEYAINHPVTEDSWHTYDGYDLYEYMVELGGYDNYSQDSISTISYFDQVYSPMASWSEFVNTYFAAGQSLFDQFSYFDLTDDLDRITLPGMLIFGKHDGNVPVEIGMEMDSLLINSPHEFEIFQNSGHSPMLDEPYNFYYSVGRFIDDVAAGSFNP
jgi:pimeloyl-ACP methyl ester carboxylesterase